MLFADADSSTWAGVAVGALGVLGSLLALARSEFASRDARKVASDKAEADRLAALDRMQFDAKVMALESSVADCQEKHKECTQSHAAATAELAQVKAKLEERDEKDKAELKREIAALRAQVNGDEKPK